MKKKSLIIGFLVILVSVMLVATTSVFAADDLETLIFSDNSVNSTPSSTPSGGSSGNTNTNNTTTNNTNTNRNTSTNNTNTSLNTSTNNVSSYNNATNNTSNLPKTGIEDSIPTMVLIVVFGISAIYAYKKIKDYNNI